VNVGIPKLNNIVNGRKIIICFISSEKYIPKIEAVEIPTL
jgi:hypothetical protein